MTEAHDDAADAGRIIRSCFARAEDDAILLYSGPMSVSVDDTEQVPIGDLELRLFPRSKLTAHVSGPFRDLQYLMLPSGDPEVSIPEGARLAPPDRSLLPEREGSESWSDHPISLNYIAAGDFARAEYFLFHIAGSLRASLPWVRCGDEERQEQLAFDLPGWKLVLAEQDDVDPDRDFSFVVKACPTVGADVAAVERLRWTLFLGLSFIASREVGVAPVCGLTSDDELVWLECGPPRLRIGDPGVKWCPRLLVHEALPVVLDGLQRAADDRTLHQVLIRAFGYLRSADGSEVLDVRVPMACAGLELVSWAVLQREGWMTKEALDRMPAGAAVRLLMQWVGVGTDIPGNLHALEQRSRAIGQPDWSGPEVVFNVRNGLVHPPKRITDATWPTPSELIETWQLATWYLELALLRLINYSGRYASRLELRKFENETELVPWAARSDDEATSE